MVIISMNSTKIYLAVTGVCLANFLTALDFAIVNTALPVIQHKLHATSINLQWVMNIFVLAICLSLVLFGRLSDKLSQINY